MMPAITRSASASSAPFAARVRTFAVAGLGAALPLFMPGPVVADEIYATAEPCGGFLGCNGFDVFIGQTVGVRFTPTSDFDLDTVGMYFMSNNFDGPQEYDVTMTVQTDQIIDGCSTPSGEVLDTVVFRPTAIGWDPVLEVVESVSRPRLEAGVDYWIVCSSDAPPFVDPVWTIGTEVTGFTASTQLDQTTWQCGGNGAVASVFIDGTRIGADYALDVPDLVAGAAATISVVGGTPDASAWLAYSRFGEGSVYVEPLNITVQLDRPLLAAGPVVIDGTGAGSWTLDVPLAASGRTVFIQSFQNDARSDVVETTIR